VKTIVLTLTKEQKDFFAGTGRIGGQTGAKNLTSEKRLQIARKASKAAAAARAQRKAAQSQSQVTKSSVSV
jgi:hypothetical protein